MRPYLLLALLTGCSKEPEPTFTTDSLYRGPSLEQAINQSKATNLSLWLATNGPITNGTLSYTTYKDVTPLITYINSINQPAPFNYIRIYTGDMHSLTNYDSAITCELVMKFTNAPDGSFDYHATNMVMTTRFEPIITKTNGHYELRFREPVTNRFMYPFLTNYWSFGDSQTELQLYIHK